MAYQPYLVAPSRSGISTYLKPWLQPEDAVTNMEDCFVYRGVIQKRDGYVLYDTFPESVGIYNAGMGDGVTTTFNFTIPYLPVGKRSLAISHYNAGVLVTNGIDDGAGAITGTNIAALSTINYATGAIVLNFTAAPTINTPIKITYGVRLATGDGVTTVFAFNLNSVITGLPIKKRSVFIKNTSSNQFTNEPFDTPNSAGTVGDLTNVADGVTAGNVTYATGAVATLTFAVAPPAAAADQDIWGTWEFEATAEPIKGIKFWWDENSAQKTLVFNNTEAAIVDPLNFKLTNISGPAYFNTASANFFSVANYLGYAFILNNTDRLTVWDGTSLYQPIVALDDGSPTTNNLTTGLHTLLYKNRLLILRPTIDGVVKPQQVMYSALNNPFDWRQNVGGGKFGGFIDAPTAEWIIGYEFLRDEVIVHFQDSTWRLRYTAVDFAPYRWEKINDSRRVDSPYGCVSYQNFETSVGSTGLLKCDGPNVARYDENIIDFTSQEINQDSLPIVNGYRNDLVNQQYLCFASRDQEITDYCDQWLVWNFVEETFTKFNIESTTFGAYFQEQDLAWEDFNAANNMDWAWEDFQDQNWLAFFSQGNARIPMFGTKNGEVMQMVPDFATDNGTNTGFEFTTIDFNPFVKQGQRVNLGFVDFYFDRPDGTPDVDEDYLLTIEFYMNENPNPIITQILNPSEDNWQKKRVYCNLNAQFVRFRILLTDDQITNSTVATKGFTLSAYTLYMAPGGRLP